MQSAFRGIGEGTVEHLNNTIASILSLYPPKECANYYEAVGYGLA